jgi:hypothetical protein
MPSIDVPSIQDIHRIAYLTMHGWEPGYRDVWEKHGVLRKLTDDEKQDNRRWANTHKAEEWDLESAYWRQKEISDPPERKANEFGEVVSHV